MPYIGRPSFFLFLHLYDLSRYGGADRINHRRVHGDATPLEKFPQQPRLVDNDAVYAHIEKHAHIFRIVHRSRYTFIPSLCASATSPLELSV